MDRNIKNWQHQRLLKKTECWTSYPFSLRTRSLDAANFIIPVQTRVEPHCTDQGHGWHCTHWIWSETFQSNYNLQKHSGHFWTYGAAYFETLVARGSFLIKPYDGSCFLLQADCNALWDSWMWWCMRAPFPPIGWPLHGLPILVQRHLVAHFAVFLRKGLKIRLNWDKLRLVEHSCWLFNVEKANKSWFPQLSSTFDRLQNMLAIVFLLTSLSKLRPERGRLVSRPFSHLSFCL